MPIKGRTNRDSKITVGLRKKHRGFENLLKKVQKFAPYRLIINAQSV